MEEALLVAAGYILGSLPWATGCRAVPRRSTSAKVGSGNVGASNVWRVVRPPPRPAGRSLLDVGKGLAARLLGLWSASELIGVLAGTAALAGHWRPLFLGFARGGKVVATTGGVVLALAPLVGLLRPASGSLVFLSDRATPRSRRSPRAARSRVFALLFGASWPVIGVHDRRRVRDRPPPPRATCAGCCGARSGGASFVARARRSGAVLQPVSELADSRRETLAGLELAAELADRRRTAPRARRGCGSSRS